MFHMAPTMFHMAHQPSWSQRVATRIRTVLAASDISVRALAEATGIPLATLSRRVRGLSPWDTAQIEAVAEAIHRDPNDLMRADDSDVEAAS